MDYRSLLALLERAEIVDLGRGKLWPGGGYVWLSYGLRLKELMFGQLVGRLHSMGYEPLQMPSALPGSVIRRVSDAIVDLSEGTYWLSDIRNGQVRVTDSFANSTNDAVMSFFLRDVQKRGRLKLPVRYVTRHQILRSHRRTGRAFLNSDENTDLVEAYFVASSTHDAMVEFDQIVSEASDCFNKIGVPHHIIQQSMWGNKPVANKVTSLQSYAAQVSGSTRLFSVYFHGTRYAKLAGLKDRLGGSQYAEQVGFGFWEGAIIPILDAFRDEHGLLLPPNLSPVQIMITPRNVEQYRIAKALKAELSDMRVSIDFDPAKAKDGLVRNKRFIRSLGLQLVKGIPLRVTIVDHDQLLVSRRDVLRVDRVSRAEFLNGAQGMLESLHETVVRRANVRSGEVICIAETMEQLSSNADSAKLSETPHCGDDDCAKQLEAVIRGEFLGYVARAVATGSCVRCGARASKMALVGRRAPTP